MKKIYYLLLAMLCMHNSYATNCISTKQVKADYATNKITVSITWTGCGGDASSHRNTAWVFVDYRAVTGGTKSNTWSRATIAAASSGTVVNSGNSKGVWIYGTNSTSQTVTLTLNPSGLPAQYDWCAFATDYPPNAATYNNGTYTLRGTKPFVINGTTVDSKTYSSGIINVITDATGCPGWIERDVRTNNGTCAPGLTKVGGVNGYVIYCRNLPADNACSFVGPGFEIKKNYTGWQYGSANTNNCPSGWRIPNVTEVKLMWDNKNSLLELKGLNFLEIAGCVPISSCNSCSTICRFNWDSPTCPGCQGGMCWYCAADAATICIR